MIKAKDIIEQLANVASEEKKKIIKKFFKTGIGEYGYGDVFIGVATPQLRAIAKVNKNIEIGEIIKLLNSPIHEERLIALIFLIDKYKNGTQELKKEIFDIYISHTHKINNWDLVDISSANIVGNYLFDKEKNILFDFARSNHLWEKRISIVSTLYFIKQKEHKTTFQISDILLNDSCDLIQKAIGWMLREVGKNCGEKLLCSYLDHNSHKMARTTLRYAIERLPSELKKYYMKK